MSVAPEEVAEVQAEKVQSKQNQQNLFVHNIKRLMAAKRFKEAALARATAIPQPTLHKILSSKTIDPRISTLNRVCDFFNVSLDALMYTPAHERLELGATGVKRQTQNIPVISWEQCVKAGSFLSKLTPNNGDSWRIVTVKSDQVIALLSKISMEPRFPVGTLLLADLNSIPADGDLVAVHYPNTDEATLRQLCLDGPIKRLKSVSNEQGYDICDEDMHILGVVIQATRVFVRTD